MIENIIKGILNLYNKFHPDEANIEIWVTLQAPSENMVVLATISSIIVICILSYFYGIKDALIKFTVTVSFLSLGTITFISVANYLGVLLGLASILLWFYLLDDLVKTLNNSKKPENDNDPSGNEKNKWFYPRKMLDYPRKMLDYFKKIKNNSKKRKDNDDKNVKNKPRYSKNVKR